MNLKTEFTRIECDRFRELCNFTPDERAVFDLRVQDKSIVQISMALSMSEATVKRKLHAVKKKIVKVM